MNVTRLPQHSGPKISSTGVPGGGGSEEFRTSQFDYGSAELCTGHVWVWQAAVVDLVLTKSLLGFVEFTLESQVRSRVFFIRVQIGSIGFQSEDRVFLVWSPHAIVVVVLKLLEDGPTIRGQQGKLGEAVASWPLIA